MRTTNAINNLTLAAALWTASPFLGSDLLHAYGPTAAPQTRYHSTPRSEGGKTDWLIDPKPYKASIQKDPVFENLILQNGLIRRTIRTSPNAATVEYTSLVTNESIIRAVRPEALLTIDGRTYAVGGLFGQPEQAYILDTWLDSMASYPNAFHFAGWSEGPIQVRFPYVKHRWGPDLPWPPPGRTLALRFDPPSEDLEGLSVSVHYEIFDGLPVLSKWIFVQNRTLRTVRLNTFISENLAVPEPEVSVDTPQTWDRPNLLVASDHAFRGMTPKSSNRIAFWIRDTLFATQVNYTQDTPCVLECRPELGPDIDIRPGEDFSSFRIFELVFDSFDKERKGLSIRRMFRTMAPWVTENPIFMHLVSTDPKTVRLAVDQCVETGFEMVILSFGSGLDMETADPGILGQYKDLADYAHNRHIEIGGYSLLASRRISEQDDVIDPKTGQTGHAVFGNSPCLGSPWGIRYFDTLKRFFETTGFDILEHDGSYPGDVCASVSHPGHRDLGDSQWTQWRRITGFYQWCRNRGIYLNVPDWYFLAGSNKTAIGYRETNWSLPRERQILLGRQNLFDGTWEKTPSMGWTFVPLVQYHGGGEAATLEPLAKHLTSYRAHLVQNFGYGVQACYRGTRLYDTEETMSLVKQWVGWYKRHRDILNSDIIHIRRPDGRDLDAVLHVNPSLPEKGLLLVFNPTDRMIERDLTVPLYYTGLEDKARVRTQDGSVLSRRLNRKYEINLPIRVPPHGEAWFVID